MPPPPGYEQPAQPTSVTVHMSDIEPFAGLAAACARFSAHLAYTPAVYDALNPGATLALTEIQAILWRLEHSSPEPDPTAPAEEG
jgi:hypothetical protein